MRPRHYQEDQELITNQDLTSNAHALLEGIDLDVASSKVANRFVQATEYYTPSDDGLNVQDWYGSVYLFPPAGAYFWDKKNVKWKKTRATSSTLVSSHAVWFRRLYREWWKGNLKQALYMTNLPDMIRMDQRIFDFPICVLSNRPQLIRNTSTGLEKFHKTSTTLLVYMPPHGLSDEKIQRFIDIYSPIGRCVC
jgi:hypothetical protein